MVNDFDKFFRKIIRKHLVPLIIVFLLANTSIGIIIFTRSRAESCMTQSQIDSDARCLYVYQNHVYEKGTRENPHKGVPCSSNVDSTIPNLHFVGNILTKFNSARIAPYCTATLPTDSPTEMPIIATEAPTQEPTMPPIGGGIQQTPTPTQIPTIVPQQTLLPTPTEKAVTPSLLPVVDAGITFEKVTELTTQTPKATVKPANKEGFDLTKISKPVTYLSLFALLTTIVLIIFL